MAAPETTRSGVGLRHVQVLALNASGYPNATDTTYYAGVTISGAKSLAITDPEPRGITHVGDDGIFALDVLPPTEAMLGTLTVGKTNDAVDEVLTDTNAITVGEGVLFGIGADNRGDENQVCLIAYRQTLDTKVDSGTMGRRNWECRIFPKCFVIPVEPGLDDTPETRTYAVRPQFVTKYPWGHSVAAGTEGFTRCQGFRGIFEFKPRLVAFLGDNSTTEFTFEAAYPAQAATKMATFVNGTEQTANITEATDGVSFTTAPTTDAIIAVIYEHE